MWKNLKSIDKDLFEETFELDRSLVTNNNAIYIQLQFIAERLLKYVAYEEKINNSYLDDTSTETLGSLLSNPKILEIIQNPSIDLSSLKHIQKISNKLKHSEQAVLFEIDIVISLIETIYNLSIFIGKKYKGLITEEFNPSYFEELGESNISKFLNTKNDETLELKRIRLKKELDSFDLKKLKDEKNKKDYMSLLSEYKQIVYDSSKDKYILNLSYDLKENQEKLANKVIQFKKIKRISILFIILSTSLLLYFIFGLVFRNGNPYYYLLEEVENFDEGYYCYVDECFWYFDYYNDIGLQDFDQSVYIWLSKNSEKIKLTYFPSLENYGEEYSIENEILFQSRVIDSTFFFQGNIILDSVYYFDTDTLLCEDYYEDDDFTCDNAFDNITYTTSYFNSNIENIYINLDLQYRSSDFLDIFMSYYKTGKKYGFI